MRNNKRLANLIFELEYIIGSECYNPNSYDGYTGEEGREFRYPVYGLYDDNDKELTKFRGKVFGIPYNKINILKYKFGSNHLFIGIGLIHILQFLEKRYNINFDQLEYEYQNKSNKK